MKDTRNRRAGGFALLFTVLILLLVASLGFAALNVVQTDQQAAGYLNRKRQALQAADAAVAKALERLQVDGIPSVPTTTLSDSSTFPHGQPSYGVDPTVGTPIKDLGLGGLPGMNLQTQQNGTPLFQVQYWQVSVQGSSPGGTVSRVEFATGNLVTN